MMYPRSQKNQKFRYFSHWTTGFFLENILITEHLWNYVNDSISFVQLIEYESSMILESSNIKDILDPHDKFTKTFEYILIRILILFQIHDPHPVLDPFKSTRIRDNDPHPFKKIEDPRG